MTKELPSNKRILIVEDDDAVRQMLQTTLEVEGFNVKTARDGRNIMNVVQNFQPHLIISDVMMPGGGGYEVLRSLQAESASRKIPVLVISGYKFDDSTKNMLKQEPNVIGFLEKPLRPTSFTIKVHDILKTQTRAEWEAEDKKKIGGIEHDKFNELF